MKPLHFRHFATAFLAVFISSQISAQDFSSYNNERPLPKYLNRIEAANYPEVNAMVLLSFKRDYGSATDVHWSIVENKYMAKFFVEGKPVRMLFDKKGHMVYSISEGTIKNLPADVRKAVRSIYYDYDIKTTAEVHTLSKTAWFINLEDETSIVTVKVMDGEVIETGNYRKSK